VNFQQVHNKVNRRLANEKDQEQDPNFPKVLFPSKIQCPKCHVESEDSNNKATWDLKEVLDYLIKYYSSSNLARIEETAESKKEEPKVAQTSKIMSVLDEIFSMRNNATKNATIFDGGLILAAVLSFLFNFFKLT